MVLMRSETDSPPIASPAPSISHFEYTITTSVFNIVAANIEYIFSSTFTRLFSIAPIDLSINIYLDIFAHFSISLQNDWGKNGSTKNINTFA